MLYNKTYNLFRSSPEFLRKLLYLVPVRYRLGGKDFVETYNFLKKSEFWSKEKLVSYQEKKLQQLLNHAIKNIPYYSDIDLKYDDPFKNLKLFPVVDKDTIRNNKEEFISNNISKKNTFKVTTGGTTGDPLEFRLDNSSYGKEWAFKAIAWGRVGYEPGDKLVTFRGVNFNNADKGIYWQDNPIYNMFEMSPFHMNEKNLPRYIEKIKKIGPKFLHGYPSALTNLAKFIKKRDYDFPPIKAVLPASENLYEHQRKLLGEVFDCRVFSFYGLSERVIMSPECEHSNHYHAFPQYGITEILDEDGNEVDNGKKGELVGTGFLSRYMPFIRYRTGDYGKVSKEKCKCGRNHQIIKDLVGKGGRESKIIKKDGSTFTLTPLYYTMHGSTLNNVDRIQFYQKKRGEIILRIV
ncbi:MAG: phenylacetate--CoA ligase family protein, partial [archaeon]